MHSTLSWEKLSPARRATAAGGDAPVARRARSVFFNQAYVPLRQVVCDYHEGVLCLRGRVPSFYLKQVAQELVRHLDGVEQIANQLEVAQTKT